MTEQKVTLSGKPPDGVTHGAPQPIDPASGMHRDYYVLSAEERAKGFVRPVRLSYRHVGIRPKHPVRPLTDEQNERYSQFGYEAFEPYMEPRGAVTGRFWTLEQLNSGCGTVTTMNRAIAETYARNPTFYRATFCCHCGKHLPVGKDGEFEWNDGSKVGT